MTRTVIGPVTSQDGERAAPAHSILPPYLVLRDVLDEATIAALLDYALAREADFAPTLGKAGQVDASIRQSVGVQDLGRFRPIFEAKIFALLPSLISTLRVSPVEDPRLQITLVAHGDGAFFARHIDTHAASGEKHIRALTAIYYFNAEPKGFSGGALRLYAIGPGATEHVDIEPLRNSILVYPSWAQHEVLPVSCPSKKFVDSRFAVNCWVRSKNPSAGA